MNKHALPASIPTKPFQPRFYLKGAMLQTLLASLKIRAWGKKSILKMQKHMILHVNGGTRLLGYYTPQPGTSSKGLVILLHGWEGSSQSTYILTCGTFLYQNGFSVFRLNLRDHGNSHHLNKGLFYATLLEEVWAAVDQAAKLNADAPVHLVGFSLGGNFAIRIAARYAEKGGSNIHRVVSISPVLDPNKATDKIDGNPMILGYFLRKWRKSLAAKQRLFPNHYNFDDIMHLRSLRKMTARLLETYTHYASTQAYFHAYSIPPELTQIITLPLTILTSSDDPIIPVEDFHALKPGRQTEVIVHDHGGHNGFIEGLFKPAWYDWFLLERLGGAL